MEWRVDLAVVSRTLEALLLQGDRSVAMLDRTTGQACQVSPGLAAAPEGLLPAFLVAADTIWREATGRRFGVDLAARSTDAVGILRTRCQRRTILQRHALHDGGDGAGCATGHDPGQRLRPTLARDRA